VSPEDKVMGRLLGPPMPGAARLMLIVPMVGLRGGTG
jgi:hypothetical protein